VDMELDSDDLDVDVDDGSGAALVTELAQTHAKQGPRLARRHGVRSVSSSAEMPAKSVMEELEEAAAISSIFAGPAPQSQQFAGHRCVHSCLCPGASGERCGAIYLTALLCGASALSGIRIPVQRPPATVEAPAHVAPAASPLVTVQQLQQRYRVWRRQIKSNMANLCQPKSSKSSPTCDFSVLNLPTYAWSLLLSHCPLCLWMQMT
jgi:hypothetical protein